MKIGIITNVPAGWTRGDLVTFHTAHKLSLLAHDPPDIRHGGGAHIPRVHTPEQQSAAASRTSFRDGLDLYTERRYAEALAALRADHAFLLEGGVFSQGLIDSWIDYKKANEVDPVALRPTPYEFYLYFDV